MSPNLYIKLTLALLSMLAISGCSVKSASLDSAIVAFCNTASAASGYHGGTGTALDPYLICNATELEHLTLTPADWASSFKLVQDIDLSSISNQVPIGVYEYNGGVVTDTPYTGVFDGNSKTITGLNIEQVNPHLASALFANAQGAEIKDLNITGATIAAVKYGAVLIGFARNTTITGINISTSSVTYPTAELTYGFNIAGLVARYELTDGSTRTLDGMTVDVSTSANDLHGSFIGYLYVTGGSTFVATNNTVTSTVSSIPAGGNTFGGFIGYPNIINSTFTAQGNTTNLTLNLTNSGSFSGGMLATMICNPCTATIDDNVVNLTASNPLSFNAGWYGGMIGVLSPTNGSNVNIRRNTVIGSITVPAVTNNRTGVGGMFGSLVFPTGTTCVVQNNVAKVDITIQSTGSTNVGGLGGYVGVTGTGTMTFENNYAVGTHVITATGINHGGLLGSAVGTLTANGTNSYYSTDDYAAGVGNVAPAYVSGLTRLQMQDSNNFVGWDFATVWDIIAGGIPFLR